MPLLFILLCWSGVLTGLLIIVALLKIKDRKRVEANKYLAFLVGALVINLFNHVYYHARV